MTIVPRTIADLQSQGVAGAWVTCRNPMCLRSTPIGFAAIGLAPETPFPPIAGARRFVCVACGSGRVDVSSDWREHWAAGMGDDRQDHSSRALSFPGVTTRAADLTNLRFAMFFVEDAFWRMSGRTMRKGGRAKTTPSRQKRLRHLGFCDRGTILSANQSWLMFGFPGL
jgi:hypothetical protein